MLNLSKQWMILQNFYNLLYIYFFNATSYLCYESPLKRYAVSSVHNYLVIQIPTRNLYIRLKFFDLYCLKNNDKRWACRYFVQNFALNFVLKSSCSKRDPFFSITMRLVVFLLYIGIKNFIL